MAVDDQIINAFPIDLPGLNRIQSNLKVLDNWKAVEIPPSYILQSMTMNASALLGLDKERGFLEKSYFADIIAIKKIHLRISMQSKKLFL